MTMQFLVTGKQIDVGQALKEHIETSLTVLVEKYFGTGIEAHAVISREAHRVCADISVRVGRGILLQGSEKGHDAYAAFDGAAEHIAKRMRRYKRRLRDHHTNGRDPRPEEQLAGRAYILAPEADVEGESQADTMLNGVDGQEHGEGDQPIVIAEMATDIPLLTVCEAVMRMDLADQPTLMFRNSAHGGFNVVYRRADGHIGWIDPSHQGTA
ncbi:MAG TPA: ribosome-associated translation inhibitor RaiA [Stellaceae bacterium]|nr:ribosome-associated translation inhibitor RaiA [Stellaceae bacterium]